MKWIPSWLAKAYISIYVEKHKNKFDFEEAKSILKINTIMLSKRLRKLEEAGFIVLKRDSIDKRKKYFRLIEPNDVIFSYGVRLLSSSESVIDRLTAAASKNMDFVIGGSYAAYVHAGYATPGKIDIYVDERDKDRFISLLSDKFTSVSVDDSLAEKIAKTNVHIHSSLTEELKNDSVKLDGIRYVSQESLVINGLVEQSEFLLTDAFAILIKKRKEIDFKKILKIAKSENCQKELGASLELINLESKKKIFNNQIINDIFSVADLTRKKFFPRNKTEENMKYRTLSKKRGLRISLSSTFISKIITDLVV